jgi:molybdopterin synthase catalytic subunit
MRFFAAARDAAGRREDTVPGVTVSEVLDAARVRYGAEFGAVLETANVWVNGEPAIGSVRVTDTDEVAVLPPVSGGAVELADRIELLDHTIPVGELHDWAVLPGCGGVVVFSGTVRDHSDGREGVTELEYEAYEPYAQQRMEGIAREARDRWPVLGRIAMVHRVGVLGVTDTAVAVVVSAPHRAEAFEAGRYLIDELKARVPIWKRETWPGGSEWSVCEHP